MDICNNCKKQFYKFINLKGEKICACTEVCKKCTDGVFNNNNDYILIISKRKNDSKLVLHGAPNNNVLKVFRFGNQFCPLKAKYKLCNPVSTQSLVCCRFILEGKRTVCIECSKFDENICSGSGCKQPIYFEEPYLSNKLCMKCAKKFNCIVCKEISCYDYRNVRNRCTNCEKDSPDTLSCIKCSRIFRYGNIGAPMKSMCEKECLYCDINIPHFDIVFTFPEVTRIDNCKFIDVATIYTQYLCKLVNNPPPIDIAVSIVLTVRERFSNNTTKNKLLKMLSNDGFGGRMILDLDNNKCAASAIWFMLKLPNDIRLMILRIIDKSYYGNYGIAKYMYMSGLLK